MSRWWRLRHSWAIRVVLLALRRDPQCRSSDRVEAAALVSASVLTLLSIPLAVAVAMPVLHRSLEMSRHQHLVRHEIAATVVSVFARWTTNAYGTACQVTVAWTSPDRRPTHDSLPVSGAPRVGCHIPIWINADGDRVAPPLTTMQARADAVAAGLGAELGEVSLISALLWSVRRRLLRIRVRAWDAEWTDVSFRPRS